MTTLPFLPVSLTNPITGDVCWLLQPACSENGNVSRIRFDIAARAAGSPWHYHSCLTEIFTVESGLLAVAIGSGRGRKIHRLTAGQSVCITPGTTHRFWNPTDARTVFVAEVSPGSGFEKFIAALYGLARNGKTRPDGMPKSLLVWACLLHWADFRVVGISLGLQKGIVRFLLKRAQRQGVADMLLRYAAAASVPASDNR